MKYLTGRTGWDAELSMDVPAGQTHYSVCCGAPSWEGVNGPLLDYEINQCCIGEMNLDFFAGWHVFFEIEKFEVGLLLDHLKCLLERDIFVSYFYPHIFELPIF